MNAFWLLLKFASRNVFRHRMRSFATLAAVSLGVAGLILAGGFVQDIFYQLGEAVIHSQSGHIQLVKKGYREGRVREPQSYYIDNPEVLLHSLAGLGGVKSVMGRLTFTGVINNGKRDVGVVGEGIDPVGEKALGTYLRYIEGRALDNADYDGIVLGQGVARSLGVSVGDHVSVVLTLAQGAVNSLDFTVVGVFQSFSKDFDARAVRIPLVAAQELIDQKSVHVAVVLLKDTELTTPVTSVIKQQFSALGYEVANWRELSDFYEKTINLYDRQFGVLRFIILFMVILSVANSVNMTLFERTREFGTLLAMGDKPRNIFALIVLENAVLGLLGACCGVVFGCLIALAVSKIGIPMPPPPNANIGYTASIRLSVDGVLQAGAIGFVATFLAAILPAVRMSRLQIAEAIRSGI